MEDDKGLDLTLSLPCHGPSAALTATGSEVRMEEADSRGSKLIDDFKNFLDGSNHKEEPTVASQRIKQSKPEENVCYDLSTEPSSTEVGNKRKNMVNRHERGVSTAENEDVADSEADDVSKRSMEVGVSESTGVDLKRQRAFAISPGKEVNTGQVVSHGVAFPSQTANVMNLTYSMTIKGSNSIPPNQHPVIPANVPFMFGYSPVQVATVSTGAAPVSTPKPFDRSKGDGKSAKEAGPSMHTEASMKGTNAIDQSKPDGYSEYPAIRPGIAAELKFGGSGSSPSLPWVSTTAPGPNGKTISGVTYKYSATQIRIVCACHGSHMSPEEFVQHATEEQPNLNSGLAGLP